MAVKTGFSRQDFETILSRYSLGEYRSAEPFKHGAVHTNVLLITTKGQFVFRYYESRSLEYALFEVYLLDYLVKHAYPCPGPIPDLYGSFTGNFRNKPFAVFEFMAGKHSQSLRHYDEVAAAMGKLHALTEGFQPPYSDVRDTYDPESCWRNATLGAQKIHSKDEAQARLAWLKAQLTKLQLPVELPKGICHCDAHYSNFLFRESKLVAVLDFDDASYIHLLYDVANMIFFWTWLDKGDIDFAASRKLLKAYEQYRQITELEKHHLFDYLKMVIFMGIGWFLDADDDFRNARRKIESLNAFGRDEFFFRMFGSV